MNTQSSTESADTTRGLWRIVAEREITTRMRDKTFLVSTAVMLVVLIGIHRHHRLDVRAPPRA